jgi:N-acetylglucosamine-6-phosphate deacetylase
VVRLGVARAFVDGSIVRGDVELDGDQVGRVDVQPAGRRGTAVARFVDLQVNGSPASTSSPTGTTAGRALAAVGVTAYQPTFITAPPEAYRRAIKLVAGVSPCPGGPRVVGIQAPPGASGQP